MPKLTNRVPSYRLHKASGQAIVTLDGKDHYLGVHGTDESKANYDRITAEWLANRRQTPATEKPTGDLFINELIDVYWDYVVQYYVKGGKPTGEQQAIKYSLRPLSELYGDLPVDHFGPAALRTVRQRMIEQDWCRKFINTRINRIRRMFKWAVEHEFAQSHILEGLRAVAPLKRGRSGVRESDPVTPVSEEAMKAIEPFVSRQVWAMVQLQWLTGMRPCEVTIMRGGDIDQSQDPWLYRPSQHKTEHHGIERLIFPGPKAQKVITAFLKSDPDAFLFSPVDARAEYNEKRRRNRKSPMTPSQAKRQPKRKPKRAANEYYSTASYGRAIARACDLAFPVPDKIEHETDEQLREELIKQWRRDHRWSPNQLRHAFATNMRKQVGIEATRTMMGHTSAVVTEIYAEADYETAAKIMAKAG